MRGLSVCGWVILFVLVTQLLMAAGGYAQVSPDVNGDLTRHAVGATIDEKENEVHVNAQNSPVTAEASQAERRETEAAVYSQTGSLFKAGLAGQSTTAMAGGRAKLQSASWFAVPEQKPRTIKKHDLITVIINETASVASDAKANTDRDTQLNATATQYMKLNQQNLSLQTVAPTTPAGFVGDLQRNFKSDGQDDRTDSFTTRLSAEVVDVKPNGTLVVEAKRNIQVNTETQHYLLSGVCRAEDVTPDNTILSTQLSDLDLRRDDQGMVHDATKQGGLMKILDFINPF
jgi:flagellar L-ring protein precursor FlgH